MTTERIQLEYELQFSTPFHCGTGLRAGLIDRTIVRDHDGYLYVPGSTIKGVLREHCEQLARLYEEKDADLRALIASPHDGQKALLALGPRITMITRIFGGQSHPGLLYFEDARQSDEDKEQYDSGEKIGGRGKYRALQTDLYTQAKLNRLTHTAAAGALYTSEFGVKGFTLHGSIGGWLNCTPIETIAGQPSYSLLLLLAGLHMLRRIGGNKSTGKGECSCVIKKLKVGETEHTKEIWEGWLDALDALSHYSEIAADTEWQEEEE